MKQQSDNWNKTFLGIKNGKKAFCGPYVVQIDLTDRCNSACIGCWVHSTVLDKKSIFPEGYKELPFGLVEKLIKELYVLGTRQVILSGSGEPFMHPDIFKVIELIKSRDMHLNIITNGEFLDKKTSEFLVDARVDLITASVWAGSAKTYLATHHKKKNEDFQRLKDNLKGLASYKRQCPFLFPHLKIYNVICSRNYYDIKEMVGFAKDVDADSVEFQIVDIIEGKTDFLTLNMSQKREILQQFKDIRKRNDMVFYDSPKDVPVEQFMEEEFSDYGKLWKNYKPGFVLNEHARELKCPRGRAGEKIFISHGASHNVTTIQAFNYKFRYDGRCDKCNFKESCFNEANLADKDIAVDLLNILSVGTFLRRIFYASSKGPLNDRSVNSNPCYIGWHYARILTNGNVIPCCKAALHPLGNIHKRSFARMWNSYPYREFRLKAKTLPKSNRYFSKINCIKSCDNWGLNSEIHIKCINSKKFAWKELERKRRERIINKKGVSMPAIDYMAGNFNAVHDFGEGIIIDGGKGKGFAEYEFNIRKEAIYELWSLYASLESRRVELYIDDNLIKKEGLKNTSGGWSSDFLKWHNEFEIKLKKGRHVFRISTSNLIPHIKKFAFLKKGYLRLKASTL